MAARNCRERKTVDIDQLETETSLLRQERRVQVELGKQMREEIAKEEAEIDRLRNLIDTDRQREKRSRR